MAMAHLHSHDVGLSGLYLRCEMVAMDTAVLKLGSEGLSGRRARAKLTRRAKLEARHRTELPGGQANGEKLGPPCQKVRPEAPSVTYCTQRYRAHNILYCISYELGPQVHQENKATATWKVVVQSYGRFSFA